MPEIFTIFYSSKHKHCILKTPVHGHPPNVSTLPAITIRKKKFINLWGFLFCGATAQLRPRLPHTHTHTHTHTSGRTPLNKWSACRRSHYVHTTQQTHETKIRDFSGIRTIDPSNPAAADLRLRLHGHQDQSIWGTQELKYIVWYRVEQNIRMVLNCYSAVSNFSYFNSWMIRKVIFPLNYNQPEWNTLKLSCVLSNKYEIRFNFVAFIVFSNLVRCFSS